MVQHEAGTATRAVNPDFLFYNLLGAETVQPVERRTPAEVEAAYKFDAEGINVWLIVLRT